MAAAVMIASGTVVGLAEAEERIVRARPLCAFHPAQRALLERLETALRSGR